jgi:Zn-dependent alcohol dehydrogenase
VSFARRDDITSAKLSDSGVQQSRSHIFREHYKRGLTILQCIVISKFFSVQEQNDHVDSKRLPSNVSLELGAILEPLSVAIHASRRAALAPSSTVLIFGAGAVGLLCAAMSKVRGAKRVLIADIQAERVDFAVQNKFADAKIIVPMKRPASTEEKLAFAKEVAELVKAGEGEVDAVFECTGVESCLQAAIYVSALRLLLKWPLLIQTVNTTGRTYYVDRDGESHSDTANICSCTSGDRSSGSV